MKIANAPDRLSSLWGFIDTQHNQLIASRIVGPRVLDIGCGYGSLVDYLGSQGFAAEGWDRDPESIAVARRLFPTATVRLVDAEDPGLVDYRFDSVVLKDCIHHLAGEGDVLAAFRNIRLLLKPRGRLVILDPNPMWLLRVARKLARHLDPEASCDFTLRLLNEQGFEVKGVCFHEIIGLPLSGGYVGVRLVPNWRPLNRMIAAANGALSRVANRMGLGRAVCWRYVIHADARAGADS
jgi:SAM-dependent methyltransferase